MTFLARLRRYTQGGWDYRNYVLKSREIPDSDISSPLLPFVLRTRSQMWCILCPLLPKL
jgi:hypothetical protein